MMSDRFDELIRTSAAEMPDPGEYRRMNRVPLRAPVKRFSRIPRPRHSFVMAATCLALMVLFSGQIAELGSDDLEMQRISGTDWRGQEQTLHRDEFTGMVFNSEGSEEEVKDLQHAFLAQDGPPVRLIGMAYGGKEDWDVYQLSIIEGIEREIPMDTPPELPTEVLPRMFEFYPTYYRDIRMRAEHLPHDRLRNMTVYGVEFEVKSWKKTYPGYGEVTFSIGLPVD